jgi:hypothetical protein
MMRTSRIRADRRRSKIGKIVLALAVTLGIGALSVGPALSDENRGRDVHERDSHKKEQRIERERHAHRRDRDEDRAYVYAPPPVVYSPPPVVYTPPPSPGISIFFPIDIR